MTNLEETNVHWVSTYIDETHTLINRKLEMGAIEQLNYEFYEIPKTILFFLKLKY